MIVHEYTTVDDSIIFHTVSYDSIPKGATVRRSLPIEEFYSEENLIDTYFEIFHKNVGTKIEDIKTQAVNELREIKRRILSINVKDRTHQETEDLCDITAKLGSVTSEIEKSHVHIGRGLYVTEDAYKELLEQCKCLIVFGGSSALSFTDLKRAITNYHELICTTPNTQIEFWLTGQDIGRYRLFQYSPRDINQLERAA